MSEFVDEARDLGRCIIKGEHLRTQRHTAGACLVGHVPPRDINHPEHVLTVRPLGCHPGCHEVTGTHHVTEINPVDGGPTWRSECTTCATVLIANHPDQMAALVVAMQHAQTNKYVH